MNAEICEKNTLTGFCSFLREKFYLILHGTCYFYVRIGNCLCLNGSAKKGGHQFDFAASNLRKEKREKDEKRELTFFQSVV